METKKDQSLGKAERLKHRKDIQALFGSGKSFFVHPIKVVYQLADKASESDSQLKSHPAAVRVGVSASKRQLKKAVDRNRIKRLLREAYRLNKQELLQVTEDRAMQLHIFFLYIDKSLPTFAHLDEKMKNCLLRLVKMLEEKR